jgi:hypothetical protein
MRLITPLVLVLGILAPGCDRGPKLTPEQTQQVEAARQATIATSERLLGRPLTDDEKSCIKVEWRDDRPAGSVAPPLSETLKQRQAELLKAVQRPS